MKRYTLLFIFLLASTAYGQRYSNVMVQTKHGSYLEQTVKLEGSETDSMVVEFNAFAYGNVASIDSIGSDPLPLTGWIAEDKRWNGYCEIDIYITNTDLATDSLIVAVYSLDREGYARSNDVVYLKIDTFPGYSTSAYYQAWTTTTYYRASITGSFGMGTHGLLITLNPTDEGSTSGSARVRVFL